MTTNSLYQMPQDFRPARRPFVFLRTLPEAGDERRVARALERIGEGVLPLSRFPRDEDLREGGHLGQRRRDDRLARREVLVELERRARAHHPRRGERLDRHVEERERG